MDPQTVDTAYASLQQQSQNTAALISRLGDKLGQAAAAGDVDAREWQLDLRELALAVQSEEMAAQSLLNSIHSLVDNHVQQTYQQPAQPAYQQPAQYQQPMQYAQPQGGMLHRFLGGGFGSAIASGAGFAIGDDLIRDIF
ncbi:hypothetical protein P0W64_17870 [Tsukamurella sp. 8F]|uniref:hypothetical protein n=1 Tax=unclassified Tsukamurella TaxID=2633480 RepID=UPI0023B9CCBD|nr:MULTISPECIES: hypothetical protein [unclassified Tsukamurella]MDF0529891.1 hypothetical protein [Tsukamurella sp. 8J]MDF0588654.1 hypothetical protein [Tsukamurella sp. 8F]